MKPLRILLADDHALVLNGIKGLLHGRHNVVGTAENGRALVDAALQLEPDVVVLDISMPLWNGIDAGREIRAALPAIRLVFLSMHSNAIFLRKALAIGASAFVLKSGAAEELLLALDCVRRGQTYFSPCFGSDVLNSIAEPQLGKATRSTPQLTPRQREILQLIAEGRQSKEIAAYTSLSLKTVEFHRGRILAKTGARSVADLTRYAIEEGLIVTHDEDAGRH